MDEKEVECVETPIIEDIKIPSAASADAEFVKPGVQKSATITKTIDLCDSPPGSPAEITSTRLSMDSLPDNPNTASDGDIIDLTSPITSKTKRKRSENPDWVQLQRRKIKVAGAPKMPLTGYVRYMNDRREKLKTEMPDKTAMEHTKIIAEEWSQLTEELKTPYIKAAEVDKNRYQSELKAFLKERPDILAAELAKDKARKNNGSAGKSVLTEKSNGNNTSPTSPNKNMNKENSLGKANKLSTYASASNTRRLSVNYSTPFSVPPAMSQELIDADEIPAAIPTPVPGSIPIFTEEFLEHNKIFDMELRNLRKSKSDFEQQNSVLEKHVENMKFGVEKIASENDELQEKNRLLATYLDKLKVKLAQALSGLAIPSEPNGATVDNIDKYMTDLYSMATTNTHGPASLNKAKDIIRKLDLHIQL